ncbi:MAG: PAS domain S-box protein [Nitrospirota bacterium]
MTIPARFKYKRAFWMFMSILLLFMLVSDIVIVSTVHKQMLDEVQKNVRNELDIIATFVMEPLLKNDYAKVEEFLTHWAREHEEIVEVSAVMPNNFLLAEYKSEKTSHYVYRLEKKVSYGSRDLIKLHVGKDLSSIEMILSRLKFQLVLFSILFTVVLGALLWRTIRTMALKPLESEIARRTHAEEMLREARDELEERVRERTAELQGVNRSLLLEIADRKKVESALKESEEKFRAIFDNAMDGILLADIESKRFLTGNKTVCGMLGLSEDEVSGLGVFDIHPEKDLPYVLEQFDKQAKRQIGTAANIPVKRKDGTVFYADISSSPFVLAGKNYLIGSFRDITERMKAEEALKEAVKSAWSEKAKLDAVIAALGDGISIQDTEYKVLYQNEIHKGLIGEHVGEYCYQAYEKRAEKCEGCPVDMAFRDGKIHTTERTVPMPGGTLYVEITASPLRDSTGTIIAGIEVVRDISRRKETEKALLALSARNEAILSAVPDIIMEVNAAKVYTWANQAGYEFFGEDVLGREASYYFEGEQPTYNRVKPLFTGSENVIYVESWQRRKDGMKRLLAWWCRVLKDEQGNVTGALSTARDITEQKKSEEALRISEEKFSKAFRSSPAFVTISTVRDGRFIEVNDAFLEASGYGRNEMLGKSSLELGIWADTSDREIMLNLLGKHGVVHNKESRLNMKSGEMISILYSAELINIEGEECIIAIMLDITERKKLEDQLLQAQKMEAVGQLAGGVAHDFNNIITAIFSYGYLLRSRLKDEDHLRDNVDKILSLSDRAAQITRGLLTFSRKQHFEFVPVRLNEIVSHVESMLVNFIGEDIEVRTMLSDRDITIVADRTQIEQVIINLATNARDAMPDGGRLNVETDIAEITEAFIKAHGFGEPGIYALLSVSDTGTGMDEETRQKVFEPFFTTKDVDKGTGLGLSVVYGIIKQHNGYINIYSEQGRGTTFRIYLPEIKASVEMKKDKIPLQKKVKSATILVAEDESAVRDSIINILQEFGYKVIEAVDGQDAIVKFTEHKNEIQLLLLDVVMPKKNGKEVFEEIKRMAPGIKAIFTSGYTADVISRKNVLGKDVMFVSKPILPDQLISKIREVVDSES